MRKRILPVVIASIMALSVPAYASKTDDQIQKIQKQIEILQAQLDKLQKQKAQEEGTVTEEEASQDQYTFTDSGNTFTYINTDVVTDNGKLYVVIYFSYTNNTGEEKAPGWQINNTVFQNGLELSTGYMYDTDIPEHDKTYKEVLDGTTITFAEIYELSDMSDITIKMQPFISWGNSPSCKFTVSLIQQ